MSYAPTPYQPQHPYTPPGGDRPSGRRNLGLIGGIVVACTAVVLGSILLVAFLANRDDGRPAASDGGTADQSSATVEGEEAATDAGDADAGGDPETVAVAVATILYGVSEESAEDLVCSDPGYYLTDLETMGATVRDTLGEDYVSLIDEMVATDSRETGDGVEVDVAFVIYGVESDAGTVELVVEDGRWKACDFAY
ncbi:hypothetical protein GCM10027447_16890 [Glycomyces halotolerans]